jgi:hypothetical protein
LKQVPGHISHIGTRKTLYAFPWLSLNNTAGPDSQFVCQRSRRFWMLVDELPENVRQSDGTSLGRPDLFHCLSSFVES